MRAIPTIGRADIDVHYDGKGLPEEARALGEETGGEAGEAHAEEFDKAAKEGFDETSKDIEKKSGESGERSGRNFGVKYGDSVDKTLKQRLQKTSDEVAKVFSDDDGVRKFTENYKGAGTATDVLRGKLDELHDANVINDKDYETTARRLTEYAKKTDAVNERLGTAAKGNDEFARSQKDANDRIKVFIDQASNESIDRINRMADGFDELHDNVKESDGDDKTLTKVGDGIEHVGKSSGEAAPRVRSGNQALDDLRGVLDRVKKNNPDADLERLGKAVDHFGTYVETGGRKSEIAAPRLASIHTELRKLEGVAGTDIDALGRALGVFADGADGAGKKADGAAPGLKNMGGAFRILSQFDPADNMGQLFALIIALAPQVAVLGGAAGAGLVILGGGIAAVGLALGGGYLGFSNLFGDLQKVQPAVRPAAEALQKFAGADGLQLLRDALQKPMFEGLAGEFDNLRTKTIPDLEPVFASLGGAINKVLKGWTTDLQSSGFKKDFGALITSLNPSVEGIGTLFSNVVGGIGKTLTLAAPYVDTFIGKLGGMAKKYSDFLETKEGKREFRAFFDEMGGVLDHVGGAFKTIGDSFKRLITPQNVENTKKAIDDLADAVDSLVTAGGDLNDAIPLITGAIKAISKTLEKTIDYSAKQDAKTFGKDWTTNLADGIQGGVLNVNASLAHVQAAFGQFFQGIGKIVGANTTAISDLLGDIVNPSKFGNIPGDLAKYKKTLQDGFNDINRGAKNLTDDYAAYFQTLPKSTQTSLNKVSGHLGIAGHDAEVFGGTVKTMAETAGVDIRTLDGKNLNGLIGALGLTGSNATEFRTKFGKMMDQSGVEVDQLDKASQSSLNKLSDNLGDTGKKSTAFQKVVAKSADDAGVDLQDLANTKSLPDLEKKLGVTGDKSKTEFANKIIAAARDSGESIDKLPPKIQTLVDKYGTIPKTKTTDVNLTGEGDVKGAIGRINAEINSLHDRTVNVAVHYEATGKQLATGGAQFGATGGIMAGGRMTKGGKWGDLADYAFANGGILNRATLFGNVVAGEAGAEAIVPLTGPLSAVDKSVRELSAIARGGIGPAGYDNTPGRNVYVADGAVRVYSNADPRQIASATIDRLSIATDSLGGG